MSTGIAGIDAVENSKYDVELDDKKKQLNDKVVQKTIERTVVMQSHIYANANMHPMHVVLMCICVVVVLYVIYTLYKPNASGIWISSDGKEWNVHHSRWFSNIKCASANVHMNGFIRDNLVTINDNIGIWNYGDVILFVDGGSMQRIE